MDLQYPIGRFAYAGADATARRAAIEALAAAPRLLRAAVARLDEARLDTPYRDGGWTVRQVVHHLADSHLNAYVRLRLALTEDLPVIKPYDERRWAELEDARRLPVEPSLELLAGLHARWTALLEALPEEVFAREFRHPELGPQTLDRQTAMYAWHGRHHTAQIAGLRERMGW